MKASEIQTKILTELNLKTSVSNIKKGSMKGYIRIRPMFQNGKYPDFDFNFIQSLKLELLNFDYDNKPVFCSTSEIFIYQIEDDRIIMAKESKPKLIDLTKTAKGWGSKNSQMRLDKATQRNAKKLMKGGVARYY